MAFKNPSAWAGNWGTGVQRSGAVWAANYVAAGPAIFQKAAAAVNNWQNAVASPAAAAKFVGKLNAVNFSTVTTTVNGPGLQKYTAAGVNKQANFAHFASIFGPKLQGIVTGLPPRGPSGSPQNITRLLDMLTAIAATKGHNF